MKCVILAGGFGTRISEETKIRPKPMIKIGRYPLLWHIMKIYSSAGINDFIICTGYKNKIIENYYKKDFIKKKLNTKFYFNKKNRWKITCVYTGKKSQTAGRLLKLKKILKNEENFFLTYGDGLSDINIKKTLNFFNKNKKLSLVSVVRPPARFGEVKMKNNLVKKFVEKIDNKNVWINGGFFIMNTKILDFIKKSSESLEYELLPKLVKKKQLICYKHLGFWQAMDTLRDKIILAKKWKSKKPDWKIWK